MVYLDFEEPIREIDTEIQKLKEIAGKSTVSLNGEIRSLKKHSEIITKEIFRNLTPWQVAQVARHPLRPYTLDYIPLLFEDFIEMRGDRAFGDDPSIITGIAKWKGRSVALVGNQKGRETKDKIYRNFGMAHPEGYRKAARLFSLAEKFGWPVISLIDTPGAYPGLGAEERGQAEAIARNLKKMSRLSVPSVSVVIGEGGSGGALGIGITDKIFMLEYSIYSVISPEACAAILWRDASFASQAASALKCDAKSLLQLNVIDGIIREPLGGAHRSLEETSGNIKQVLDRELEKLLDTPLTELLKSRMEKYSGMGFFEIVK